MLHFLACTLQVRADYVPQTLSQLILRAEKVLYGEITCVDDNVFEIRVLESLDADGGRVTIRKFEEWNCGKRWFDYEVGQKSMFFLRRLDSAWYPMGGGNEGELPIHDNRVYIHASTLRRMDATSPFEPSDRPVDDLGFNNPYNGFSTDLCPFWEAVCTVRSCFRSEVGPTGDLVHVQSTCPERALEPLLHGNPVLGRVVGAM